MTSARHGAGYNLFFHAGIFDEYMDAPRRTRTASLPSVSDRFGMVPPKRRVRHSTPDSHPFPSHTYHRHLDRAEGNLLRKPLSASASAKMEANVCCSSASASTPPHLQNKQSATTKSKKRGCAASNAKCKAPQLYLHQHRYKYKKKKNTHRQVSSRNFPALNSTYFKISPNV